MEVFTQKKLCSRLYSIEIEFCSENKISLFELPLGRLMGNVRIPYIALWKPEVDFLFLVIELFRYL